MSAKMRVLIAYDGLDDIHKITKDLQRAGLPENVEAVVLSVVDAFMPPQMRGAEFSGGDVPDFTVERIKEELRLAQRVVEQAGEKIKNVFPQWVVSGEACVDSPAWAIVKKASAWKANLIVVGSHNQTEWERFFLGSVSQKVLTEAACPVRIVRSRLEKPDLPAKIVIGLDGSPDSTLAVKAVAERIWEKGTSVYLITIMDKRMSTALAAPDSYAGRWMKKNDKLEQAWIQRMMKAFGKDLTALGLQVVPLVMAGDPKRLLLTEAKKIGADCIFVGSRGLNMLERFFVGSVSSAVAARAACSVEVVRPVLRVSKKIKCSQESLIDSLPPAKPIYDVYPCKENQRMR